MKPSGGKDVFTKEESLAVFLGLTGIRTQVAGFKVLSHNQLDHKTLLRQQHHLLFKPFLKE